MSSKSISFSLEWANFKYYLRVIVVYRHSKPNLERNFYFIFIRDNKVPESQNPKPINCESINHKLSKPQNPKLTNL